MNEGRIVLPIPPGKHWGDELPMLQAEAKPALPDGGRVPGSKCGPQMPTSRPRAKARFGPPPSVVVVENVTPETKPAPAKTRREKKKADPKLVAAARELRDRWLEHVNAGETLIEGAAKYDVSRVIAAPPASIDRKALPHAARAA